MRPWMRSKIRDLTRTLARTERAAVYGRMGACTQEYGTLVNWLIDVVNILTGHLDELGGSMFPKAPAFAGNGGFMRGSPRLPSSESSSAVSSPQMYAPAPECT